MFNRNYMREFPPRARSRRQPRDIELEKGSDGVWQIAPGVAAMAVSYLKKFRWSAPDMVMNGRAPRPRTSMG